MASLDRQGAEAHVSRILSERSARLAAGIEALAREIAEPISLASLPEAQAPADGSATSEDRSFLVGSIQGLSRAPDQIALLDRLLEGASRCFSRACLLLVQSGEAVGWSSVGLPEGEQGDPARSLKISLSRAPHLGKVLDSLAPTSWNGEEGSLLPPPAPGERIPHQAIALPLLVHGRVSAILYGDDGGDAPARCDGDLAEVLTSVASLAAEKLALQAPPGAAHASVSTDLEIRIPPVEDAVEAMEGNAGSYTLEPDPLEEELEYSSFVRENSMGSASVSPDEARLHDDARRFARLLVSELLLYHEDTVVAGRRNRDISERLKPEIQRSREAYDQRVPESVRSRTDYFHEELIRTLAQGDALALGD